MARRGNAAAVQVPEGIRWTAIRDGCGRWALVNERGERPLESLDPETNLRAVHRAASAIEVHAALEWAVDLLDRIEAGPVAWGEKERARLMWSRMVLLLHVPPIEDETMLRMRRRAREAEQVDAEARRFRRRRGRRE